MRYSNSDGGPTRDFYGQLIFTLSQQTDVKIALLHSVAITLSGACPTGHAE